MGRLSFCFFFFFSSRRRHTRLQGDWSSDVCSSCLFPYIYSSIRQCCEETLPLLRPMYLEYPSRDEAYQYKTQYLFGDHLLAVPITTAGSGPKYEAERQVWFPEGTWYDFFTGEKFDGNQTRTVK